MKNQLDIKINNTEIISNKYETYIQDLKVSYAKQDKRG